MSLYDEQYRQIPALFGAAPSTLLDSHAALFSPQSRVLDIGVGQGRNALPLVRQGHRVTGIDTSHVAIDALAQTAKEAKLELDLWQGSVFGYTARDNAFDVILLFGLLQMLHAARFETLVEKIDSWLTPKGLLFISAWHSGDPAIDELRLSSKTLEPGPERQSFQLANGEIRSFFAPKAILSLSPLGKSCTTKSTSGPNTVTATAPSNSTARSNWSYARAESSLFVLL